MDFSSSFPYVLKTSDWKFVTVSFIARSFELFYVTFQKVFVHKFRKFSYFIARCARFNFKSVNYALHSGCYGELILTS